MQELIGIGSSVLLLAVIGLFFIVLMGAFFHLRQQVAFVPTGTRVMDAMLEAAELRGNETVLDLGAGDARFLIALKKEHPHIRAVGYEGAWWVYAIGRLRLKFSGTDATLMHRDFFRENFSEADVIFTYLSIHAMKKLLPKFQAELRPGARIISNAFSLRGIRPERVVDLPHRHGKNRIWIYVFPFKKESAPTEPSM